MIVDGAFTVEGAAIPPKGSDTCRSLFSIVLNIVAYEYTCEPVCQAFSGFEGDQGVFWTPLSMLAVPLERGATNVSLWTLLG